MMMYRKKRPLLMRWCRFEVREGFHDFETEFKKLVCVLNFEIITFTWPPLDSLFQLMTTVREGDSFHYFSWTYHSRTA